MKISHYLHTDKWKNPFIYFSPFLVLYFALIIVLNNNTFYGDESRYIEYATIFKENLLSGTIRYDVWAGPGYSILLAVLSIFKIPLLGLKLLNGIFIYASLILLFKSLIQFVPKKISLLTTVLWGCYYPFYDTMTKLYTEAFTIFLISLFSYYVIKTYTLPSKKNILISASILAYLSLTKIIFGYVIYIGLSGLVGLSIFSISHRKTIKIHLFAILFTIPYLFFTYKISSNIFYWGTAGGASLYSMSSLQPEEHGSWIPTDFIYHGSRTQPLRIQEYASNQFQQNHASIITELKEASSPFERDAIYKKRGIQNIKSNPSFFFKNWIANISRMLFRFPFSYYQQDSIPLLFIIPNSILLTALLCSFLITIFNWKAIPSNIKYLLLIVSIYLGLSSIVSAYPRQFYIIIPILLLWIATSLNVFLWKIKAGHFDHYLQ